MLSTTELFIPIYLLNKYLCVASNLSLKLCWHLLQPTSELPLMTLHNAETIGILFHRNDELESCTECHGGYIFN